MCGLCVVALRLDVELHRGVANAPSDLLQVLMCPLRLLNQRPLLLQLAFVDFFNKARAWFRSAAAALSLSSKSFGQVMWPFASIVSTPKVFVSKGGRAGFFGNLYLMSAFPATIDMVLGTPSRRCLAPVKYARAQPTPRRAEVAGSRSWNLNGLSDTEPFLITY